MFITSLGKTADNSKDGISIILPSSSCGVSNDAIAVANGFVAVFNDAVSLSDFVAVFDDTVDTTPHALNYIFPDHYVVIDAK